MNKQQQQQQQSIEILDGIQTPLECFVCPLKCITDTK